MELYRLDEGPLEKTNLAVEHADRAAAMLSRLKAWHADTKGCHAAGRALAQAFGASFGVRDR